jgi:hypothetical protein
MPTWIDQYHAEIVVTTLSIIVVIAGGVLKYLVKISHALGNIQGALKPLANNVYSLQVGVTGLNKRVGRVEGAIFGPHGPGPRRRDSEDTASEPHIIPFQVAEAVSYESPDYPYSDHDLNEPQAFSPRSDSGDTGQ